MRFTNNKAITVSGLRSSYYLYVQIKNQILAVRSKSWY